MATPVFLPRESHGWRSLAGYSPWVAELDTTEQLHFTLGAWLCHLLLCDLGLLNLASS